MTAVDDRDLDPMLLGCDAALAKHLDDTLDLGESLAAVHAAPDGSSLLETAIRLNTTFWAQVFPLAQVLEAAQHQVKALGAAWRDRMRFRQATFRAMFEALVERNELDWRDDLYVGSMSRLLRRALLRS